MRTRGRKSKKKNRCSSAKQCSNFFAAQKFLVADRTTEVLKYQFREQYFSYVILLKATSRNLSSFRQEVRMEQGRLAFTVFISSRITATSASSKSCQASTRTGARSMKRERRCRSLPPSYSTKSAAKPKSSSRARSSCASPSSFRFPATRNKPKSGTDHVFRSVLFYF